MTTAVLEKVVRSVEDEKDPRNMTSVLQIYNLILKCKNLRSLTNFNAYIDAINQRKPIEGKLLKFYLSEKANLKSKRFYSFAIELPSIEAQQAEMPEEKVKKLVDNIVEVLNRKFL